MNYRYMRIIVFFDLPTESLEDKRNYRHFRKHLITEGYIMLQESVYAKLALNRTVALASVEAIRRIKPPAGDIQVLIITEKQFSGMEYIIGESKTDIINSDERFIDL